MYIGISFLSLLIILPENIEVSMFADFTASKMGKEDFV